MKMRMFQKPRVIAAMGVVAWLAMNAPAQDSTNPVAPQLSYGLTEVVKLAQAKVSDDAMIAYIKNSRSSFSMDAAQIIYLRQLGVSDAVITAMLNHPKHVSGMTSGPTQTTPAAQPATATAPQIRVETPVVTAQPTATYVQAVPTTYYYQPYYHPAYNSYYDGWPYTALSLSFGWVSHGDCGWHAGGGWHGGGGWHAGGHH